MSENLKQGQKKLTHQLGTPTLNRVLERWGYPLEKHKYHTADGYINTVYRIPGPKGSGHTIDKNGGKKLNKPVAIYQHGLIDCCFGILADKENSLGLKLVNDGYDLWINNSRGNRYSRDHQLIDLDYADSEDIQKYWSFSFSEMGEFDQKALW